jgi:hypothetical protein
MKAFYLELSDEHGRFEAVNQFVFDHRSYALNDDGNPRYTEHYIVVNDDGSVEINYVGRVEDVGVICRMLGQQPPISACSSKGFFDEPTHVRFYCRRSHFLYDLQTGERWKRAA